MAEGVYDDYDALGRMVAYSDRQAIEEWLRQGKDIDVTDERGTTILFIAIMIGAFDMVCLLADHGADVNHRRDDGLTPLMQAVICSLLDFVTWLVENGADISAQDADGRTALDYAVMWGREPIMRYLKSLETQ